MNPFKIFKKNKESFVEYIEELNAKEEVFNKHDVVFDFPDGELVNISDEIIDTEDEEMIAKFKHNLQVIKSQIISNGNTSNFFLIREDDELPNNWQWEMLSKNTKLEKVMLPLSQEIRKRLALKEYEERYGNVDNIFGYDFYGYDNEKFNEILRRIPKNLGKVTLPSHFRSTKHFTINTPLENTGDYNFVTGERNFIILDNMENFINSGYGYSISYHDAYLDVSHEGLNISMSAIILINEDKYKEVIKNRTIAEQLKKRKVILYRGETQVAINMLLSQLGAMSFRVGGKYIEYDSKMNDIMTNSLKKIARDNNLLYDKSHGGTFSPSGGHFTDYYDEMNKDYTYNLMIFYNFLLRRFPNCGLTLRDLEKNNEFKIENFFDQVGVDNILEVIESYNKIVELDFMKRYQHYLEDRKFVDFNIHKLFTLTIQKLNEFFMMENSLSLEDEQKLNELIINFYQSFNVKKEIQTAKEILAFLEKKWNFDDVVDEEKSIVNGMRI